MKATKSINIAASASGAPAHPDNILIGKLSRRHFSRLLGLAPFASLASCGGSSDGGGGGNGVANGELTLDVSAKVANPDTYTQFEWFKWTFDIDQTLDTVGAKDGKGQLYVRLFTPKTTAGTSYPLVAALGGLGNDANMTTNSYARTGSNLWANDALQAKYPSYVMTVTVPWEACVNYEAEMAYMFQIGQIIKAVNARNGNVDLSRIYATGTSQGAGWSYEAAATQPDLFAGLFINSGTVVHTTWGDVVDLQKLKDVSIFIAHGNRDQFIPVNEAYRAYNDLKALGKNNLKLDVINGTHGLGGTDYATAAPLTAVRSWQDWLFAQKKGVGTAAPTLTEVLPYTNYLWAGRFALADVATWTTEVPYSTWVEARDNPTWTKIKDTLALPTVAGTSSASYAIGRIRIGDETATTYDSASTATSGLAKGQTLCMTVQGYTGSYGDDLAAFNREWDVEWAVMAGQVTSIVLTTEASAAPIARPSTVNLTNGGGPNTNNSLATSNVLDGKQVYIKIALADAYTSGRLKVYVRFIRKLGTLPRGVEYASYWHAIDLAIV
jgi:predicted esterase